MKHRWTKTTWPKLSAPPWVPGSRILGKDRFDTLCPIRRCCVQCGAIVRVQVIKFPTTPLQFYAPLGDSWRKITRMPECEGLPAQYEAPVGA